MISSAELRSVTAFSDVPEDQIEWFLSHVHEVCLHAGETFVRQGDPADSMFIFLEGLFQWRGEFGGESVSLPAQAGEVSGVFPFSRMKRFTVTGRAITEGRLARFPSVLFPELIQRMPELTTRLVGMMSDRIREGTRIEQQRDRLVSLGRLSAGLAHELNNPASAAKRASDQMRGALARLRDANSELLQCPPERLEMAKIEETECSLLQSEMPISEGLAFSDLEEVLESIIRSYGFAAPWELSATLARSNMPAEALSSLLNQLNPRIARAALARIAASAELAVLLRTIEDCASRMVNLVRTIKDYTNMDQGPLQDVDVARSLDTTLEALAHRLQTGIKVRRKYEPVPLLVNTVGTELNQVWTNIIENAIDALQGEGELCVRTFREDRFVVVEIADNGSGIPSEIRPYIFDPFFTTKGVGEGTGLGLNTAQIIVRKHGGNIQVTSKPGDTSFQIWLPWADAPGDGPNS